MRPRRAQLPAFGWSLLGWLATASLALAPPQTRMYFVAADGVAWDYAPRGIDQITGKPFATGLAADVMNRTATTLGRVMKVQSGTVHLSTFSDSQPYPSRPLTSAAP